MPIRKKWWGLIALIPTIAMVFLDQSVLPVALPTIQREFGAGSIALEWTVNAYLLATTVLVLAGGKLGDRIGHRKAFSLGIALFGAASVLCGGSAGILGLIAFRTLQGVGAALLFPATTTLLMQLFPPKERGKAIGINLGVSSLFLIFGPMVGGYLTQAVSWRWIFWLNIPLSLLGLFLTLRFIPKSEKGGGKIDLWGFLFFLCSATFLVISIMEGRNWGWDSPLILLFLAAAFVFALCLFSREKRAAHPFLDLSLYRHPVFKAVNLTVFSLQFILMISVFRAIFYQNSLGWTPLKAGFVTFLSTLPLLFVAPLGGMLSDRFGPRLPLSLGFSFLIASFFWVGFFIESSLPVLLIGLIAMSFGIPLIFTPSYSAAMSAVPPQKAGAAFGTITCIRYLGGTLGVAAIGALIDNIDLFSLSRQLKGYSPAHLADLLRNGSQKPLIFSALAQARLDGFFYTHLILAFLLLFCFLIVMLLYRRKSAHRLPKSPTEV